MKIGQFFKKMVGGAVLLVTLACPLFTSCYDDSKIWNEIDKINDRIDDLQKQLNDELAALKTLLESQIAALQGKVDALVTVSKVESSNDGVTKITLSDGTDFTVYPAQNNNGLVTTIKMDDDVLYWAVYANGQPKLVTDTEGSPIPVVAVTPQVRVDEETALVEISFDGGETWEPVGYNKEPGGLCVFTGAEVVYTDNYTDEQEAMYPEWNVETPMYVTLTLADGGTITLTIDGAANFMFANPYGRGPVTVQYVNFSGTTAIPVSAANIENWVKEVPAGWQVVEDTDYLAEYGQAEFHVTAPSAEAIASGAAVAEGDMKVLAVAKGGKTITASVHLTTVPFSAFSASKGNVSARMNSGVGGYLLGVSALDEFDAEAIVDELKSVVEAYEEYENWEGEMMKEYTWSPWYPESNDTPLDDNYMESSVEDYPLAELALQNELVAGEQYVVWAVALNSWFDDVTYASGYTVGDIVSTSYLHAFINVDESETVVTFNDIRIKAEFVGVTTFFGGFEEQYPGYATTPEDVVANLNEDFLYGGPEELFVNDESVEGWNEGVFTGNPNDLVNGSQAIEPGKDYYLYLIPAVPGKTEYSVSDVYWFEFTSEALMAGSSIVVTPGEAVLDYQNISVPLSAEGAVYMYYKFMEPEMVSTVADKQAYLLENGLMAEGGSVTASMADLSPSTTRTLLAMAVDEYGCYGEVFQDDYTTETYVFASAVVTAELQGTPAQTGYVKISCDADVKTYYYLYCTIDDYKWSNPSYLGGTVEGASSFIALTPESDLLTKVAPADVPAEGILMEGLTILYPSVFVVSAELTDGTFTKATVVPFTPSMDLGDAFVYATDDNGDENPAWKANIPDVDYDVRPGEFNEVSWSVSNIAEGFKAITACFHEDYLLPYPSEKDKATWLLTYEYIYRYDVVEGETYIEPYASPGYIIAVLIQDAEGNYYSPYFYELKGLGGGFGV